MTTFYQNSTFRGSEPTWANACVGNNGNPSYISYANGYSEAANLLIRETLKSRGGKYLVDYFIYPICFNMRHSVELRLKNTVLQLIELSKIKLAKLSFDLDTSHDIGKIWNFIKHESLKLDKRYSRFIDLLDEYITDISEIDATGQTFRYPFSNKSKKHLVKTPVISIGVLYQRFSELEKHLKDLNFFNNSILEEYSMGTFTKNLSRVEILKVAKLLPPRAAWRDASFDECKIKIKKDFDLSNNEFTKAVNFIQTTPEFSSHISITPKLKHLDIKELELFFECWYKKHPKDTNNIEKEEFDFSTLEFIFSDIKKELKIEAECWEIASEKLNAEQIGELKALYYFGSCKDYSENYKRILEFEVKDSKLACKRSRNDYRENFIHLLNKTNALHEILISLYFLACDGMAEFIIEKYDLENHFDWLESARNKELFRKHDFLEADY